MGRRQRDVLEQQLQDQDRLQQRRQVLDRRSHNTWNGCVMGSRPELRRAEYARPTAAQATKFRAHQAPIARPL